MIGNFWCQDCTCGAKGKGKDFQIDIIKEPKQPLECPNSKKSTLKLIGFKTIGAHIDVSKHAKGRLPAERNKRRTDDFNKNTLPTLTGFERKHFESKKKKK